MKNKCKENYKNRCKDKEKCKDKKCKIKNNYEDIVNENIIRILLNNVPQFVKKIIGYYYAFIHSLIAILGLMVLLFSNNVVHLACLLVLVILDALSIVFLHDCPLTQLETKYLGYSSVSKRRQFLQNMGILYQCDHNYEGQLEVLINAWCFVAIKMLVLICASLVCN